MHYLAVDIGASSGRIMASTLINKKITLNEIHRFKNGATKQGKYYCWDVDQLLAEILIGLQKAKRAGITKCSLGIDTWGVDYCFLNHEGQRVGDAIAYRDSRTEQAPALFATKMPLTKLYAKTGIQIQPFNTIFQLLVEEPERADQAATLLFMPDYLNYCLTGQKFTERTIASTSQLLNLETKTWDEDILQILGLTKDIFAPLIEPGTSVGSIQIEKFSDFDLPEVEVVAVASHDTASAVLATPGKSTENWAYLSSGTWSLLGLEKSNPLASPQAFAQNYTNEAGINGTTRFLKNIMGMWLIQEVARNFNQQYSFAEFVTLAQKEPAFAQFIDVNDLVFLHPDNMIEALKNYTVMTQQKIPATPGQLARAIYDNLALCYAHELEQLQHLTNMPIDILYIVGGGSQNEFLNQLTADCSQIKISAGPIEATAIGNVVMQMLAKKIFKNLQEARNIIQQSFPSKVFTPSETKVPLVQYKNFLKEQIK